MAKNLLTKAEEGLTRRFYEEVAMVAEDFLPDAPANARQLRAILLDMLGYKQLPNGVRIAKDTDVKVGFGNDMYSEYEDEYVTDMETQDATSKSRFSFKASTGESSEGS